MTIQPIDLTSSKFKANPFPTFAKLRELGPIVQIKLPMLGKCWITTNFGATDRVLRGKDHFCTDALNAGRKSRLGMLGPMQWFVPRTMRVMIKNMLTMDEPDHRRLRSLVESAFVRQSVDEMRPAIERIVDQRLDVMEKSAHQDGTIDFQNEFSRQVPLAVICELLGLPERDREQFADWFDFGRAKNIVSTIWAMRHLGKLQRYLQEQFEECRKNPRPGMISALVQAELEGDRLSVEELLASVLLLLFAGHETTTHLVTVGLLALEQHPEAKAKLMADWSKLDSAVDEMLRYNSTIQMTKPRYVRKNMEFYGHTIKQGEFFAPMLAAANYDPAEFPIPERFDINRENNHHMAFGRGIHVCLGLKLAKAEAGITFKRLLTQFPSLKIATPVSDLQWTQRIGQRNLLALPITLQHAQQRLTDAA